MRWCSLALLLLAGCDRCSDPAVRVEGDYPYVRCSAVDAPEAREGRVGAVGYRVDGRTLELTVEGDTARLGAFAGPGAVDPATDSALRGLSEQGVHLVVILGGLGRTVDEVQAVLSAAASLGVPVVAVPGGGDRGEAVHRGLEALEGPAREAVFDGRRLRRVRVAGQELVLVPGSPEGRYATDADACGIARVDLEALAEEMGPASGARRYLVSWAAPRGVGPDSVSLGFGDVEAGDPHVARLAEAVGAAGGIFAFPATRALRPATAAGAALAVGVAAPDGQLVVGPVAGPPVELTDGTLLRPAAAVVDLGQAGLSYLGTAPPGVTADAAAGTKGRPAQRALTAPRPHL